MRLLVTALTAALLFGSGCFLSPQPEPPDIEEPSAGHDDAAADEGDGGSGGIGDGGFEPGETGDGGGCPCRADEDPAYCDAHCGEPPPGGCFCDGDSEYPNDCGDDGTGVVVTSGPDTHGLVRAWVENPGAHVADGDADGDAEIVDS
jgi:hypothetical protein